MRVSDLEQLFDYHYWAMGRLFQVLERIPPAQFTQDVAGSYGSLRNTLVHVLSAEWGWLERCGGLRRGERLRPDDYPTVEALRSAWLRIEESVRGFLAGLTEEDLERTVEFSFGGGPKHALPVGHLLLHAAIHGVHHRGQVSLLLRTMGIVPGDFDFLYYPGPKPSAVA